MVKGTQITHYALVVSNTYSPKNNLEKAVVKHFKEQDGCLLEVDELPEFKSSLNSVIKRLNSEHSRCKPVKVTFYKHKTEGPGSNIMLHDLHVVNAYIKPLYNSIPF
jgi:hypothetical protein